MILRHLPIKFVVIHDCLRGTVIKTGLQDDPGSTICRRLRLGYPLDRSFLEGYCESRIF